MASVPRRCHSPCLDRALNCASVTIGGLPGWYTDTGVHQQGHELLKRTLAGAATTRPNLDHRHVDYERNPLAAVVLAAVVCTAIGSLAWIKDGLHVLRANYAGDVYGAFQVSWLAQGSCVTVSQHLDPKKGTDGGRVSRGAPMMRVESAAEKFYAAQSGRTSSHRPCTGRRPRRLRVILEVLGRIPWVGTRRGWTPGDRFRALGTARRRGCA